MGQPLTPVGVYLEPAPIDGPLSSVELCNNPFFPFNEDIMALLKGVQQLTRLRDRLQDRFHEFFPGL